MLVELKARFDEKANIEWARELERAGVHVVYGLVGLKTHAKCAIVIRSDDDGIRRYVPHRYRQLQPTTATRYEDLGPADDRSAMSAPMSRNCSTILTGYGRGIGYDTCWWPRLVAQEPGRAHRQRDPVG